MKIAILESISMPAGHEVEFDRILVNELRRQGHEPVFFVPENFPFKVDYKVPVTYLDGGETVTYAGAGRFKRLWLSLLREKRRKAWFDSAYEKACQGGCDAIVIPTATFRYIRTLKRSQLINSPVPVYIIFHGINPKEKARFVKQAQQVDNKSQIHLKVITLRNDFTDIKLQNLDLIEPPVFKSITIEPNEELTIHSPLRLGFFGQYRREKNLEFFLEAFKEAQFKVPVHLTVQGATAKPEDSQEFEAISSRYADASNVTFIHKNLLGEEWERALLACDAIIMPYAAERYRYHWGAMLFTAIGFYKPVLQSPELNPEVIAQYKIGHCIDMTNKEHLIKSLETFVDELVTHSAAYQEGLVKANTCFGHAAFIRNLLK